MNSESVINNNYRTVFNNMVDYSIIMEQNSFKPKNKIEYVFTNKICENCIKPTQATNVLDDSYLCRLCFRACTG